MEVVGPARHAFGKVVEEILGTICPAVYRLKSWVALKSGLFGPTN